MICSFYSFKGGVGRSMALANVAELLYRQGLRVLMVDFDLEAPGLERFFEVREALRSPDEVINARGIIDMLLSYKDLHSLPQSNLSRQATLRGQLQDEFPFPVEPLTNFIVPIYKENPSGGSLAIIPAGCRANASFTRYASQVRSFDWNDFYMNWNAQQFFEWFRREVESKFDIILVDSRTGVTEMGGVCNYQLADVVILFVAANRQNIDGIIRIAQSLTDPKLIKEGRNGRPLSLVFVPSRIERGEKTLLDNFEGQFNHVLDRFPTPQLTFEESAFIDLMIPYIPYFAYTENVAAREAGRASASDLVRAFSNLSLAIAKLAPEHHRLENLLMGQKSANIDRRGGINNQIEQNAKELEQKLLKGHDLHVDWSEAPDVPVFFGRTEELAVLEQWIVKDRCRLITISGMRGIGKTTLSAKLGQAGIGKTDLSLKLARGIQDQFEYVAWRRLLNAPKITEVLTDLIKFLSDQQDTDVLDTVDHQISRLLSYLRQHRCLLVFDNVETILKGGVYAGQYREGYEEYGQLFQQVAKITHQSCMLLTSREKPQDIVLLEGKTRPVRSLELSGLNNENTKDIFATIGEFQGSEGDWQELTEFYGGNPLALELAANHIHDVFFGNISQFLKEGKQIFTDLRDLLNWYFDRLDGFEKEVMYWLAINREPTSREELKEDILSPKAKERIPSTLQQLQRIVPLEKSGDRFTLQPVLMEYMTEQLVEHVLAEIEHKSIDLLNNYALLKALAKDYVRESQIRLILQSVIQPLLAKLGKTGCEQMLKSLLTLLRETFPAQSGYAAGNILNFLIQFNADLRKTDFSYLSVQQTYLRGANLIDVNFAHAIFAKSVFTDIFGSILSVAFSPDGTKLAAGTDNGEVRVWQVSDGTPLSTFRGHADWVWGLAFSPDGDVLASGSSDQTIRLWNIASEQSIHILRGHTHRIRSIAFNQDGAKLASASEDWTIRIWNAYNGQHINTLKGHTNPVRSIAFAHDGKRLISGSDDQTVRIWDIELGKCRKILEGHTSQIWSIAMSHDDKLIASGGDDHTVRTWDSTTGTCINILRGHRSWICSLNFNPDDKTLASGSADGTVRLWDINAGQLLNTLQGHQNWVNSVSFSPDGNILASGSHDQTLRLWEAGTGRCLTTLQGYNSWVRSVAFSPKGDFLASGDRAVHLWETSSARSVATLQGHKSWIRAIAFSPDGTLLASGSDDQTIHVWRMETRQFLYNLEGHTNRVKSIAFSPRGTLLASGSDDNTVRLWNLQTGQSLRILREHKNRIRSVAFSPNSTLLASGSDDHTACIWDKQSDHALHILKGHTNRVWSIAFSPDGQLLATGSEDATIRLWETSSGQPLYTLQGHTNSIWSIAFSPNGTLLASSGEDRTVRLWEVKTGRPLYILQGHTNPIWAVAFSPDSTMVASGSHDNTICLWNSYTGKNLTILQGHTDPIWAVAYSPDGKILASGSDDSTCRLWNTQTGECIGILKSERPYERMNITEVKGLKESQKAIIRALGAIESNENLFLKEGTS